MVLEISKEPLDDNHPLAGRIIFGARQPGFLGNTSTPSKSVDPQAKAYEDALRASRRTTETPSKDLPSATETKRPDEDPEQGDK